LGEANLSAISQQLDTALRRAFDRRADAPIPADSGERSARTLTLRIAWPFLIVVTLQLLFAGMQVNTSSALVLAMASLLLVLGALLILRLTLRRDAVIQQALSAADAQRADEWERGHATLESLGDGVIRVDSNGRVEYINPVAAALTGWSSADAVGQPLASVYRCSEAASSEAIDDPVARVLGNAHHVRLTAQRQMQTRAGSMIAVEESSAPVRNPAGEVRGVVLVLRNVQRDHEYAAKLSHLTTHDALTGLLNRAEFEHRLRLLIQNSAAPARQHAMLFLDLDQFKVVNDTCGHAGGDELLRQIAALLTSCVRASDSVARFGGDEFAILLENCVAQRADQIADKLRQTLYDFHFTIGEHAFWVSASIGVVGIVDSSLTMADIMQAADQACYRAKEKGRNCVKRFEPAAQDSVRRRHEMTWVERIRSAIKTDRLRLYTQDIAPLNPSAVPGPKAELLLRMLDETGGVVSPMAFIPAAERYGLMAAVDRWVVQTSFREIAEREASQAKEDARPYNINLSGVSIGDDSFLDFVVEQFAQCGLAPSLICFEVTETVAIANLNRAAWFMTQLKEVGCQFALDDFGAGMSSFGYLDHLPVDFIKIDGSFVANMKTKPVARAIVASINEVSHVLGKRTIAESVENEETMQRVREMGIDYAQGWAIATPQPFNAT
jgi:diguanylate cyclase (GGDEF)-like protein/PAS domain S-box-containing protein